MIPLTSANPHPWLRKGAEPRLDELLSDPATVALMRSDRVTDHDVHVAVSSAKLSLEARKRVAAFSAESPAAPSGPGLGWLRVLALENDEALLKRGVRRDQVARLRGEDFVEVEELRSMLTRIGLPWDGAALPLPVRIDLYLTCAGCSKRPRCRAWLAGRETDAGYQAFCPNSWMFERRRQQRHWQGEAPLAQGHRGKT